MENALIVWNSLVRAPHFCRADDLPAPQVVEEMHDLGNPDTRCPGFKLAPNLIVELPSPEWEHADLLAYLPERDWLVRREHSGAWYVDIGTLRMVKHGLYLWTDLWLDVITPEAATSYHILDADEFGAALRAGLISTELAAQAMERLQSLVDLIREGRFPPDEVREAMAFADEQGRRGSAVDDA